MLWDFSTAGWKAAIREFFASLFKTMLVSAAAFIAYKLDNVNVDVVSAESAYLLGFVIVARALLSSFMKWVSTQSGQTVPVSGEIA